MRRAVWLSMVLVFAMLGSSSARAASWPVIEGDVSGIELCPQFICGAAVFVGVFQGQVGWNRHALGTVAVAVTHAPLPAVGECADITGGLWEMRVGLRRIFGFVDGELCANADNTFDVRTTLTLASGGLGTVGFDGLLDHNFLIPRISGEMFQD